MGSNQSFVSSEAALATAFVAGALAVAYTQLGIKPAPATLMSTETGKKGKKKKHPSTLLESGKSSSVTTSTSQEPHAPAANPPSVPGQFSPTFATPVLSDSVDPVPKQKKAKKKKKGKATTGIAGAFSVDDHSESSAGATRPASPDRPPSKGKRQPSVHKANAMQQSTVSIDTDGSWTRVDPRRRSSQQVSGLASLEKHHHQSGPSTDLTSDAGITTSVTGNSSPIAERTEDETFPPNTPDAVSTSQRRPLAERLLPKPRKTGVDDMLETSDYPSLARVMRVQPRPDEKPASGFSWADYGDVHVDDGTGAGSDADGEDDGWGVVKSKGRSRLERNPSSQAHSLKASETLTKKQRQNASKREAQKAAKAESETQRQVLLAKHNRDLERAKMAEQYSGKGSGGKTTGGGMSASVDEHGKLVWQ